MGARLKEVSCSALGQFFRRAEAEGVPLERLTDGVGYPLEYLRNKHERFEWTNFVHFMDNAHRIWTEEQLFQIGAAWIRSPFFRAFAVVARLLFSPRDVYRFINKAGSGAGNQTFACIKPTHLEPGPNHVVLEMRLPDDYPRSRAFWVTTQGGLGAIPQLMGLKPARVELKEMPWGARYDIYYPKGGAWLAFLLRLITWPFTIRSAARELQEANEVLKARYDELDEARAKLALQATQLSVAHTISQLIHRDLDVDRTLQAMAEALVKAGAYVGARVHLSAVADDKLIELVAAEGEQPSAAGISSTLQSRGRVMGDVTVWHRPDDDPRERAQLLEFVLPTLSMALENAISYRELSQYGDTLELRVAERTAELVQARDQLAQTVRSLEEAQEVRDRIFANINHEIRTPLTLVHLAVSDVKVRLGGALDARTLQQLDGIEMSTRKLLRLVDDLLILASGRESKLRLKIAAVDLARLLDIVVATWRPVAEQKGLSIAFGGPARCVRNVDEEKLERVVTNLISNAIKFTPSGGSIHVELAEDASGVAIAVRDTGIGIDDDLKKRLFGRFEQGRPAVHAGARGSGIGLSIVKELIEAHGGQVSVENPRGGGSVFRVFLPAGAQPRVTIDDGDSHNSGAPLRLVPDDFDSGRSVSALPRVLEPPGSPLATVLVAEDDRLVAEALGALLAEKYRVVLAGDGLTALRMAQQHMPDLLVSDVGMPGMDGLELTRRFRELPGNRLAPVVLLTAFANITDRLQGFDAGAIDYIVKPFEPAELLARVHSQLELRALALRLHQSEKLAALGTLSAGLAHEMRNPANAIVNAIEPLSELLPAELRQEEHAVAQLVGVLRECATQIAMLSRQLLGFRRPGDLEYQRTSVGDVVARANALTSQLFKSVALREELDYKGPLDCAAPLLTQVLSNLLENGAHAAGAGGWVKVRSELAGDRVVIEVSDSGPGVPPALRERIFEPFFTTKPPGSGTGLGLTMARQIVERHGGRLEVREAARGTLFHIEVPLLAQPGQGQKQRGGGR
jgi:signal transduction histidine kinase